jgi:hypothetical protein
MSGTLPAVPAAEPGGFEVGYTAVDGAQFRVPLPDAAMVPFANDQDKADLRAADDELRARRSRRGIRHRQRARVSRAICAAVRKSAQWGMIASMSQ